MHRCWVRPKAHAFLHQYIVKLNCSNRTNSEHVKPFEAIPTPRRLPGIGHLHLFSPWGPYSFEKLYDAYADLHQKYGPIVKLELGTCMIALFDPDDVKTLFANEGRYPKRPIFEALKQCRMHRPEMFRSAGLVTENDEEWYRLRHAVNWMLKPSAPHPYLPDQDCVAQDFVNRIEELLDERNEVKDVVKEIYRFSEEEIGLACFGTRLGLLGSHITAEETDESKRMIAAADDTLQSMAQTLLSFPWWKVFKTPTYRTLEAAQDFFFRLSKKYMAKARDSVTRGASDRKLHFLEMLIKNPSLDHSDIVLLMTEVFSGGFDTLSNSIGFLLYNLARNPDVQEKLYEEIRHNIPLHQPLTPDKLQLLKYLRACMKENHRLTPTAAGNARILATDAVLSGYRVPAGTLCIGINPIISLSPKYFPNPKAFIPERWLRSEEKAHPFAVLPFGHGARRCVGQRFAEQEMSLCIIRILQKFKIEYHYGEIGSKMRLNLVLDQPLTLKFIKRAN